MNNQTQKPIYYSFGALAFIVSLVQLLMTVQPSVPFWDCGEFSSAATWQQVPHPPGTPLFMILGRFMQLIIPFGDLGWKVNLVSVFSGAFTVFFLYLITIKVINSIRQKSVENITDAISVYGSAFVAALAYSFSDTHWFNSVESEVYSASTLFVAIVIYLMMLWNEKADQPGNEKYLLLIAYLLGFSTGIHLLALLTIFSITLVVYFRKYQFTVKTFLYTIGISILIFAAIYPGVYNWFPIMFSGSFPGLKNEAGEFRIENNPIVKILPILIIAAAAFFAYWGHKKQKPVVRLVMLSFLLTFLGYTTYTHTIVRANANPPLNENEPKTFKKLVSYLGREQYGQQYLWPRRTDYNDELKVYYYKLKNEKGDYVYGEWKEPDVKAVTTKDGSLIGKADFKNVNVLGELSYMFKYQVYHMFWRYLFWNYVGRESDVQDADFALFSSDNSEILNYKSGYADQFPIRFFGLPLLFGLFGIFFQLGRDLRMSLIFWLLFLMMGVLATLSQNQQQPQPRERDYFYTGAFLIYSMWIGLGTYALIQWMVKNITASVAGLVVAIALFLVPVNMAIGGWKIHSRAGNYLPFDYSYNILQSTEKDAIVFTNGDNDTFPVWYLQDVEGVRRDVRIVNLSLANTLWYVDQMKNREPWGSKKIPLSFTDRSLQVDETSEEALSYEKGPAQNVRIPVSKEILAKYTNDTAIINKGYMEFQFVGKKRGADKDGKQEYLFLVHNKIILDILQQTKFERPVYFSITVGGGSDVFSGLERYLSYEGMALRILPVKAEKSKNGIVNTEIMEKCLISGVDNSDNFSTTPKYGFKFRNLDNPSIYYDEVHRRLMGTYRQLFLTYASFELEKNKNNAQCIKVLDAMNKNISTTVFPLTYDEEAQVAQIYKEAGDMAKAKQFAQMSINSCQEIFNRPELRTGRVDALIDEIRGSNGTYKSAAEAYMIMGEYEKSKETLLELYQLTKQHVEKSQVNQSKNKKEFEAIQRNLYDLMRTMAYIDKNMLDDIKAQKDLPTAVAEGEKIIKKYKEMSDDPLFETMAEITQKTLDKLKGIVSKEDTASGEEEELY